MQRVARGPRLSSVYELARASADPPSRARTRPVVIEGGGSRAEVPRPADRDLAVPDDIDFEEYVTARGAALVRLARGLLRDPQHAEDVVQEVLVRAHQKWGTIRRSSNPDGYVYRMVVNATTSFWRRAARREFAVAAEHLSAGHVSDGVDDRGDREQMLALLRRLPAKQRVVLVLRHYEGLPDEEIAGLLGSSTVTVRTNAMRGLATMRKMLAQVDAEEVRRRA
jgi:RNA polymerase sigma-70 factor (sigma-E family)